MTLRYICKNCDSRQQSEDAIGRCILCGGEVVPWETEVQKNDSPEETTEPISPRGLGDTVERAIKKVTLGLVKPCEGCKQRRDALNRLVPYSRPQPPDADAGPVDGQGDGVE